MISIGTQTEPTPSSACICQLHQHTEQSGSVLDNTEQSTGIDPRLDHSYSTTTTPSSAKGGENMQDIDPPSPQVHTADSLGPLASPPWNDFKLPFILPRPRLRDLDDDSSSMSSKTPSAMSTEDAEYTPPSDADESDSDMSCHESDHLDPLKDPKFIVHKEQLMSLFEGCNEPGCGKPLTEAPKITYHGFAISVKSTCLDGHERVWDSQPFINRIPACNLLIPASVFIAGGSYSTMTEILEAANVCRLSQRECYNIQGTYVIPEVEKMWTVHNEAVMSVVSDRPLVLSGDARCDSPGHCATFGTYSLLDSDSHLIVAQKTVSVTDVKNSYWLEIEGLIHTLQQLKDHEVKISHLATDRHPGVQKLMREDDDYKLISHQYDLWHIVKGVKKKISASKCAELMVWARAISNHLWYCAATCNGDASLLKEKWISILHHIVNEHRWVTGEMFHACEHAPYSKQESKSRPWLKKTSKAFKILQGIVLNKKLLKDIEKVHVCSQLHYKQ